MDNPFADLCEGLAKTCRAKGVCRFDPCPIRFEMNRRYGSVLPYCDMASADVWAVVIGRMFFGKTFLTIDPVYNRKGGTLSDVEARIRRLKDAERKAEVRNCCIRS